MVLAVLIAANAALSRSVPASAKVANIGKTRRNNAAPSTVAFPSPRFFAMRTLAKTRNLHDNHLCAITVPNNIGLLPDLHNYRSNNSSISCDVSSRELSPPSRVAQPVNWVSERAARTSGQLTSPSPRRQKLFS